MSGPGLSTISANRYQMWTAGRLPTTYSGSCLHNALAGVPEPTEDVLRSDLA